MSETNGYMESPPKYYPVFLDLRGKRCVVIGGGTIAAHKVEGLLDAGAEVTVISPEVVAMPAEVRIEQRPYAHGDLDGAAFVIAATDNQEVNHAVAREAAARGILVNVVDDPEVCSAILPAVVRRGSLLIAISTAGASPVLARRLREELEARYGPEYGELVRLMWELRRQYAPQLRAAKVPPAERHRLWETILDLPLLDHLRAGEAQSAREMAATEIQRVLETRTTRP